MSILFDYCLIRYILNQDTQTKEGDTMRSIKQAITEEQYLERILKLGTAQQVLSQLPSVRLSRKSILNSTERLKVYNMNKQVNA
jgi:hypothetical protein